MNKKEYIITLLRLKNIGRKKVVALLKNEAHICDNIENMPDILNKHRKILRIKAIPSSSEILEAFDHARSIIDKSIIENITIIPYKSEYYPKRLFEYDDPPAIIYIKGNPISLFNHYSIAIIGTRTPTPFGIKCGARISTLLTEKNFTIISGLAKGCDTIVHQACVNINGKAAAIMAHGLNTIYPKENSILSQKILDNDGCLLSEYPIGTEPTQYQFIERDRLQVALSDAVFFIETGEKGGTLHAIKECIKIKKPLACLKHPQKERSFLSKGNELYINSGLAHPIENKNDLLEFIDQHYLKKTL